MTDDEDTIPPPSSQGNGRPPAPIRPPKAGQVHSGLAHKRNPALVALGDFGSGARRVIFRDKIALFLVLASAGTADRVLLTARRDRAVKLTARNCRSAGSCRWPTMVRSPPRRCYDHDNRVEIRPEKPASESADSQAATANRWSQRSRQEQSFRPSRSLNTGPLTPPRECRHSSCFRASTAAGTVVTVDQQPGKAQRAILVQFLIPIVLLVCLFALFMRFGADGGAGGIAGFSKFTGKGKRKGKGTLAPGHVRRRGGRRRGGGRAARDPRLSSRPVEVPRRGRGGTQGRAARGPPRNGKDAAGEGSRGRGRRGLLLAVGL